MNAGGASVGMLMRLCRWWHTRVQWSQHQAPPISSTSCYGMFYESPGLISPHVSSELLHMCRAGCTGKVTRPEVCDGLDNNGDGESRPSAQLLSSVQLNTSRSLPNFALPCPTLPCPALPNFALPCPRLQEPALPCPALLCSAMLYPVLLGRTRSGSVLFVSPFFLPIGPLCP